MGLTNIIILSLYAILGLLFFAVMIYVKTQGRELYGRPAMNALVQSTGKFALIVPALILPAAALGADLAWIEFPEWVQWLAVFICFESMLFLNLSLVQMGKYTKMGLPQKDNIILQTKGIYKLSRNPMYFGLFLLAIASVLYVPNPINMLATVAGMIIHHQIVKNEEKYLEEEFGEEWLDYKNNVRRYF